MEKIIHALARYAEAAGQTRLGPAFAKFLFCLVDHDVPERRFRAGAHRGAAFFPAGFDYVGNFFGGGKQCLRQYAPRFECGMT